LFKRIEINEDDIDAVGDELAQARGVMCASATAVTDNKIVNQKNQSTAVQKRSG
jgi:hypothetical protein